MTVQHVRLSVSALMVSLGVVAGAIGSVVLLALTVTLGAILWAADH